ncbi:DUF2141 domain-containing protein [Pseudocolwellia agarivorans]|uniref:DUF2141 domain-containing protein n=1 Tax=Pseudocolwellia agarivorans TaxID=1911682 RepID=UPI00158D6AFA|nr:DUF2141 domain-containing protein [Pseudocolwellia agarivorans]
MPDKIKWRIIAKPFVNKNDLLVNFNPLIHLFIFTCCFFCFISPTTAQDKTFKLVIAIKKLKTFDAPITFELFKIADEKSAHWALLTPLKRKTITLNSNELIVYFEGLNQGEYAVRAFQDINKNNILDTSISSIPKEPVAFSQNPSLFGGEPTIEDTRFLVTSDTSISLNFKHPKKKKKRKHK